MDIYNSRQWILDLDETLEAIPYLEELSDKTILITGAGGLICSALIDLMIRYNESNHKPIRIIAAARSEQRIRKRFGEFFYKSYFFYAPFESTEYEFEFDRDVDFIIHGASNTSPDLMVDKPVETMMGNVAGLKALLEYGRLRNIKRLLLISSSEIYGVKEDKYPHKESEYGYINMLDPRNAYSISKVAAESLCVSYANEYRIDTVIVRPGHVYGPTALERDKRVSSAWAREAALGKDIVMKSAGSQIRSYCYCLDCASAILTVLLRGKRCNAYNISGTDDAISINRMAEIVSQSAGVRIIKSDPEAGDIKRFNPMSNSSLDNTKTSLLGWKQSFTPEIGLAHTIQIFEEIQKRQ